MGLFDLFKGGDGGLKKHAARAANKRAQGADRWQSLEVLSAMKTPEAVEALLQRFTYRVDPSITDQEEKDLAMAGVVGAGTVAELPLRRFLADGEGVAWPVKMLEAIAGTETVVEALIALLDGMSTEYERDPQKKIDALGQLEDRRDPRIVKAVLPFVADMNESARFHAVAAALAQEPGEDDDELRAALLQQIAEEDSTRVLAKTLDGFITRGWSLGENAEGVRPKLPDGYVLDGAHVRRRG